MKIEVLKRLQEKNDAQAADVRRHLAAHRVALLNIMGSPGSGKTTLLEATLRQLCNIRQSPIPKPQSPISPHAPHSDLPRLRCAVLEGDLATLQDAERIAALGVPVAQLLTEGGCHLQPALVHSALQRLDLSTLDCVFVENVGNLVCPANFDIGEHARVVVLSVAEGDDKITKYPYMFQRTDAVVFSKCDLLPWCPFNLERARRDLNAVNPRAALFEVSALTVPSTALREPRTSARADAPAGPSGGLEAWGRWVRGTLARQVPFRRA